MDELESTPVGDTGCWFTTAPGVPTYWSDEGGPFQATLTFRVGWDHPRGRAPRDARRSSSEQETRRERVGV
jgi:hypothetical protein